MELSNPLYVSVNDGAVSWVIADKIWNLITEEIKKDLVESSMLSRISETAPEGRVTIHGVIRVIPICKCAFHSELSEWRS